MLMLGCELHIGAGCSRLPDHLGGVLHGVVEAAVLNHAPWLQPVLRPDGDQAPACFALQVPPAENPAAPPPGQAGLIRFGLLLFGPAVDAWEALLAALQQQWSHRLHGRPARFHQVNLCRPGMQPVTVLKHDAWLAAPTISATDLRWHAAFPTLAAPPAPARLHRIELRSPLLLASRSAAREGLRQHGRLPWPGLGHLLDSIARRLLRLEPALACAIGLPADWQAPEALQQIEPWTPAAGPARQVEWTYAATPRPKTGQPSGRHRHLALPGIIGTLLYPGRGDPLEAALLHCGQWLGAGQKTTLGCGQMVWTPLDTPNTQ